MAEINAALVAKLRGMTGAGMMECKKALTEAKGDLNAAVDVLRKAGARYRRQDLPRARPGKASSPNTLPRTDGRACWWK